MSSTRKTPHREGARLDRVPLPVEAARIGATGWQLARTGVRIVGGAFSKGSLQHKVLKQVPKTFSDLGPTYVKLGQIIASSPGAFGEPLSREFRSLLDRVPPADKDQVHKLSTGVIFLSLFVGALIWLLDTGLQFLLVRVPTMLFG